MIESKLVLRDIILVILGGGLGSLFRYLVSIFTQYQTTSPFPYKTLIVNVIGCLLIGYLSMRFHNHNSLNTVRLFFITGFLGGFTTFSTFSYETIVLYQAGHIRTAVLNIFLSTISGLIAVLIGMYLSFKH